MSSQPARSALLVEDHEDIADIFRRFLDPWKLEVITSPSQKEALAIVSRRSFDFYAIDLQLNDGDSTSLLEVLSRQGPEIAARCVVVTSFRAVALTFTDFPIVPKTELAALGPHLFRILGDPSGPRQRPGVTP